MLFPSEEIARQRRSDLLREAARRRVVTEARRAADRRPRARLRLPWRKQRAAAGPVLAERWEDLPLFRGLSRRALSLIARRADPMRFDAGTAMAREQDPRPEFFVITAGVGEATVAGRRVGVLVPGDSFGELTLLDGAGRVPTVTAMTDVEAIVLGRREFWGMLYAIPELAVRLIARLGEDLLRAQDRPHGTLQRVVKLDRSSTLTAR